LTENCVSCITLCILKHVTNAMRSIFLSTIFLFLFLFSSAQNCNNWLGLPSQPSYVSVGDLDVSGDQITIEAEINRTTPYVGGFLYAGDIVSKHQDPINANYLLRPSDAEITTVDGVYHITPPVCDIELNKTYHVAMVYDGKTLKFYRNGFLLSQTPVTGNLFQNNFQTEIGYYQAQIYNTNFIGYINEVRIWNVARTQAQIQAFMNTSLPAPSTQAGLLAYFTFDNLVNKQGNPAWNGTVGGSAVINQTNPTCSSFVADNKCCTPVIGTISGDIICPGKTASLTFHSTSTSNPPYTVTYSDGVNNYVQANVQDGIPFTVQVQPLVSTNYSLVSVSDASLCTPTMINGQTASVVVNGVCASCNQWLQTPTYPSYVRIGDLDIPGNLVTVEAEINMSQPYAGGPALGSDIVGKYADPTDANYLLRVQNAQITTTTGYYQTPITCDISLHKTYHIAMVYDGSSLKFYRNGFLMSQVPASGNLIQNNWLTQIGFYQYAFYNTNFIGFINEVRIWNVARTQAQIQAFMNSSLPSPATQTGLMAYYVFNDLLNKQGNATWNGMLGGSAAINQTNNNCMLTAVIDCCPILSGTLTGNSICPGATGLLTFHSLSPNGLPYTITYSDGTNTYTQSNVQDGVPFAVTVQPTTTTVYNLVSIQSTAGCAPDNISGQTATITFGNCFCSGSLGDPVVNINFGSGSNPGPTLPAATSGASSTSNYVPVFGNPASPTPIDGEYTVTNNIPSNPAWFSGGPDHTSGDGKGYMAFYNASIQPGEFYSQRIDNLCGSTTYEFAAWIANAINPVVLAGVNPDITFLIEQTDGTILGSYHTGPIAETFNFTWNQYGFFFTMPANVSSIVLKIINNNPGGTVSIGNDLAIDDITFRACGPASTASFNAFGSILTQSVCEGSWAMLYGTISAGYLNPQTLWQVSTDNGITWSDLPNSSSFQIKVVSPVTGITKTYLYRMLTGEGNNINSPSCRVVSNLISLISDAGPVLQITHDTSICAGSSLTLQVAGGNIYSWTPAQFLDNPNISNPVASPVTTTKFYVAAKDLQLCESKDSVTLSFLPPTVFKTPPDAATCAGTPVLLNGNNDPSMLYDWSPASSLNNPSAPSPLASPDQTTDFNVIITDPRCQQYYSSFNVHVDVNPTPIVIAARSNDIDCSNLTSQLSAAGASSYSWLPGTNLSDASIAAPVARLSSTTQFIVQGTSSNGCSAYDSVTVVVTKTGENAFAVPNAFTPNGDNINDCFGIRSWGNVILQDFTIYNRWGQKIFETKNPFACWDGTFQGEKQPVGGYVYVIKASSFCGDIIRKGNLLLIR
jgi:gliding motility-associated-like protein